MNKYNEFLKDNNLNPNSFINEGGHDLLIKLFLVHKDIVIYDEQKREVEMFFDIHNTADNYDIYSISEDFNFRGNIEQELYYDNHDFYEACANVLYDGFHNYIYVYDESVLSSILYDEERILECLEQNEVLIIDEDSEGYNYVINPNLLAKR